MTNTRSDSFEQTLPDVDVQDTVEGITAPSLLEQKKVAQDAVYIAQTECSKVHGDWTRARRVGERLCESVFEAIGAIWETITEPSSHQHWLGPDECATCVKTRDQLLTVSAETSRALTTLRKVHKTDDGVNLPAAVSKTIAALRSAMVKVHEQIGGGEDDSMTLKEDASRYSDIAVSDFGEKFAHRRGDQGCLDCNKNAFDAVEKYELVYDFFSMLEPETSIDAELQNKVYPIDSEVAENRNLALSCAESYKAFNAASESTHCY